MKHLLACTLLLTTSCGTADPVHEIASVEAATIGNVVNVHRAGNLWFAGKPTESDLALIKEQGIDLVINLRTAGEEIGFDEGALVVGLGMAWENPGFRSPDALTDTYFDELRALLRNHEDKNVLLHCGSANRVGAVWLPYRVLDEGVPMEEALLEAHAIGLSSEALQAKALAYVEARL